MSSTIPSPADGGLIPLVALLAGTLCGLALRFLLARLTGPDPRTTAFWAAEIGIGFALAVVFGIRLAHAVDTPWVASALGAALTTYTAASAGLGFVGGGRMTPRAPLRWGIAHATASAGAGMLGVALGLFTAGTAG
ncbi:MAG: hypothetical protein QM713_15360 [Arachnia sp.]